MGSFRAEFLKIRKRPATWVLGLIWLAVIVLLAYTLTYTFLSITPPPPKAPKDTPPRVQKQIDRQQKQQERIQKEQLKTLYPRNLTSNIMNGFPNLGGPIALILGALAVGSEYGWGTLKTIFSQRPKRLGVFAGKLFALLVVLVLLAALAFAAGAACSYVIAGLQDAPVSWPSYGEFARALGSGTLILVLWAAMGVFLAALLRSTALSIAIGLVYALVLEGIIFSLPIDSEAFRNSRKFFPGQNSNFLADSFTRGLPQGFGGSKPLVDPGQAALVLGIYIVVFIFLAALLLRRRDVT